MSEFTRRDFVKGAALAPFALAPLSGFAQGTPTDRFDFVIAGAGHNSLVCAAYLAKAGYKVLVLEGRPTIGGGTKTAEVCLPGFKEDLCSSVHSGISVNPLIRNNELNLRDYGYGEYIESDPVMHIPFLDGASITVWHDLDRTCESISRFSKKDADTFRQMVAEYKAYTAAAGARGAGAVAPKIPRAGVWQRRFAMSGYDLVCQLYESDYMRRGQSRVWPFWVGSRWRSGHRCPGLLAGCAADQRARHSQRRFRNARRRARTLHRGSQRRDPHQ